MMTGMHANPIAFTVDEASRLATASRLSGTDVATFGYDGRGFLSRVAQTTGAEATTEPVYDSTGQVQLWKRQNAALSPSIFTYVFYLGGRPVAQLEIDDLGAESWPVPEH